MPVDLLADKSKGVLFQVLTYKEENLGQELLKGARLQMVSKGSAEEDQVNKPKQDWFKFLNLLVRSR